MHRHPLRNMYMEKSKKEGDETADISSETRRNHLKHCARLQNKHCCSPSGKSLNPIGHIRGTAHYHTESSRPIHHSLFHCRVYRSEETGVIPPRQAHPYVPHRRRKNIDDHADRRILHCEPPAQARRPVRRLLAQPL